MKVIFSFVKELQKDLLFYKKNTELLAVWTLLYIGIVGLFFLALKSNFWQVSLLLIIIVVITGATILFTRIYLFQVIDGKEGWLLCFHQILNKSFRLRDIPKKTSKILFSSYSAFHLKSIKIAGKLTHKRYRPLFY